MRCLLQPNTSMSLPHDTRYMSERIRALATAASLGLAFGGGLLLLGLRHRRDQVLNLVCRENEQMPCTTASTSSPPVLDAIPSEVASTVSDLGPASFKVEHI